MLFKNCEFADSVFNRTEDRQKRSKNGHGYLYLRSLKRQYNLQLEKNIKSAKIYAADLLKLTQQNFADQIQNLRVQSPDGDQYTRRYYWFDELRYLQFDELRYLQKTYFKNLNRVKFLTTHKLNKVKLEEALEFDGIEFTCSSFTRFEIEGPHNITIKNSIFKSISLECRVQNSCDVQILNAQLFDRFFCFILYGGSLQMENFRFVNAVCDVYSAQNACIKNLNMSTSGEYGLQIEQCKNFEISNSFFSSFPRPDLEDIDVWSGIRVEKSVGKICDCSFEKEIHYPVRVCNESQVYYSNLQLNEDAFGVRVDSGSSFIKLDKNTINIENRIGH